MTSNKAIVALLASVLLDAGIDPEGPVGKLIVAAVLAALVWIVPNIKHAE